MSVRDPRVVIDERVRDWIPEHVSLKITILFIIRVY